MEVHELEIVAAWADAILDCSVGIHGDGVFPAMSVLTVHLITLRFSRFIIVIVIVFVIVCVGSLVIPRRTGHFYWVEV
jgi:hypothetical protein